MPCQIYTLPTQSNPELPRLPAPMTAFRINPKDIPGCAYYALTGPNHRELLDLRNSSADTQKLPEQLLKFDLWGYDPVGLSDLPPAHTDIPLSLIVKHSLSCELCRLTFQEYAIVNLTLRIAKIWEIEEMISIRKNDVNTSRPLSTIAVGSVLTTVYHPELRLGRIESCHDPARNVYQNFSFIPDGFKAKGGLLPMNYWPHWPKP